jgi:hypothetical protein
VVLYDTTNNAYHTLAVTNVSIKDTTIKKKHNFTFPMRLLASTMHIFCQDRDRHNNRQLRSISRVSVSFYLSVVKSPKDFPDVVIFTNFYGSAHGISENFVDNSLGAIRLPKIEVTCVISV